MFENMIRENLSFSDIIPLIIGAERGPTSI